jgi:release factor glutamine methyltransferase
MTMKELVTHVCDTLRVERNEAELIIAALLDRPRFSLYFDTPIKEHTRLLLAMKVAQLQHGVPIEYVTNRTRFMNYVLHIYSGIFIPRIETEYFVELIIKNVHEPPAMILDIGTGTGAISIALAHAFPASTIIATDISESALLCAQENIRMYKLSERIHTVRTDMLHGLVANFDLIVSNPPYVPRSRLHSLPKSVKYYEPLKAINGGNNGTMFTRVMIERCIPIMHDCTRMAVEIDEEAVKDLTQFLKKHMSVHYWFAKDLTEKNRYLFLEKIA